MAVKKIRLRRGNQANLPTLDAGEPGFALDTNRLYVGGNSANVEIATKDYVDSQIESVGQAEGVATEAYVDEAIDALNLTSAPFLELTNDPFIKVASQIAAEPVEFTKTEETPVDEVDEGLILARGSNGALYNTELEEGYNNSTNDSPLGTVWNADGFDNLVDISNRTYSSLYEVLNRAIGENIIGAELIMWDKINGKFYKFEFTTWGQGGAGTVAYTRTLLSSPNYFRKRDGGDQVDVFIEDNGEGAGVGITRGLQQGIFNPYREEGWNDGVSPDGTEWNLDGWDDLSDIEDRTYTHFYAAYGGNLGNVIINSQAVMRTPDDGKYYAIEWLEWTQGGNAGGFSYNRYEIDLTKIQAGIRFADGTVLASSNKNRIGNFIASGLTLSGNGEMVITNGDVDQDILLQAGDDLYLDALTDDVHIRSSDVVRIKTGQDFDSGEWQHQWLFESDGVLNLPNDSYINDTTGALVMSNFGSGIEMNFYDGRGWLGLEDGAAYIKAGSITESSEWAFNSDGTITFPDSTVQTTAFNTAGLSRIVSVPTSSIGAPGDQVGDVAFDGDYMYVCIQDFGGTYYEATMAATYSGPSPIITAGSIPQPQTGWVLIYNGTSYVLNGNATLINGTQWTLPLGTNISTTIGSLATIGPASTTHIWKRITLPTDTW